MVCATHDDATCGCPCSGGTGDESDATRTEREGAAHIVGEVPRRSSCLADTCSLTERPQVHTHVAFDRISSFREADAGVVERHPSEWPIAV